ncbi:MAG TPA: hypothetical protein VFI06_17585 [Chitinophagaceae bacterium]|nr:hypothetical protein [Chitinophagaceae bacterium]
MISTLGTINNRQILYIDVVDHPDINKISHLENWILFIIENNVDNPVLRPFLELCIDRDVLYVCTAGAAGSEVDDLADLLMVIRKLKGKYLPSWLKSDDDVLMTTWHDDFEEGFWFAAQVARYEDHPIQNVLVANLSRQTQLNRIQGLIKRINEGWLPPD